MKGRLLIIFCLLNVMIINGQAEPERLIVKTHVYKDGVAIRWTPSDIDLWRKWSTEGYRLERYTIAKNGVAVEDGESILLGGGNILPFSESQWDAYSSIRPEANLIRYCLKNENGTEPSDKEAYLSEVREQNECFIFSMLAIQSRFELAVAGGIGFIDKSTKENEIYLYKLFPVIGGGTDAVQFVVDMKEVTVLPVIEKLKVNYKENRILVQWPARRYSAFYFGYRIEKSFDSGRNYTPLNEVPYVPVYSESETGREYEVYSDTVSRIYQTVYYRIRGMDYFGQYGLPSLSDSVVVFPETTAFPEFLEMGMNGDKGCKIHWQFGGKDEKMIKGFRLMIADSANGEFVEFDNVLIDARQRVFELNAGKPVFYVKVVAVTLNGTSNSSFPLMVQSADSLPPSAPELISISADTAGIVRLDWKASAEKDFMAYMIFRGNSRNNEFSSVTEDYYKDTFFLDTLNISFLRDSIYYKLVAIDNRYNESGYSKVMAVFIPNGIPPAPPVIYEVIADSRNAVIHWYKSSSNDVSAYHLIKWSVISGDKEIIRIDKKAESYSDTAIASGGLYRYALHAVDYSGRTSKTSRPYEVKIPVEKILPGVDIKAVFNDTAKNYISIFWEYALDSEVSHYRIMEVNADGSSHTLGNADPGKSFFNYHYLKPYTMKTYCIIAYFKDGRRSKI